MPLHHEPQNSETQSMRLTPEQLQALLNEAIDRHSRAGAADGSLSSVEDAVEIARSLNIPEEHVLAAAEEMRRRQMLDQDAEFRERRIADGRRRIKQKRERAFFATLAPLGGVSLFFILGGMFSHKPMMVAPILGAFCIPLFILLMRWLVVPVTDEEAEEEASGPVPGRCRVCGQPAAAPNSTFCLAHQYRAPGAGR
jgi:hypothetical protein